jgi:hypothetical protein
LDKTKTNRNRRFRDSPHIEDVHLGRDVRSTVVRSLEILAQDKKRSIDDLLGESLNMLFNRYNRSTRVKCSVDDKGNKIRGRWNELKAHCCESPEEFYKDRDESLRSESQRISDEHTKVSQQGHSVELEREQLRRDQEAIGRLARKLALMVKELKAMGILDVDGKVVKNRAERQPGCL